MYQLVEKKKNKEFSYFLPLDKGHVPENLWKLSVTYLIEDTNFPIGGLNPRSYKY